MSKVILAQLSIQKPTANTVRNKSHLILPRIQLKVVLLVLRTVFAEGF